MKRSHKSIHFLSFVFLLALFSCAIILPAAAKSSKVIDISTECEFKLKKTKYTFCSKEIKPAVKGVNSKAKKFLKNKKNYEIKYYNNLYTSDCYSYMSAFCVITAKGSKYKGSVKLNYEIEPKKLSSLKLCEKTKNSITVKFTNPGEGVFVTWYEKTKNGEEEVGHELVFYQTTTSAESRNTNFKTWGKVRYFEVTGLKRKTKYRIEVFHSGAGISSQYWTKSITVKTK